MNKLVAYDIVESIEAFSKHLSENKLLETYIFNKGVQNQYLQWCDLYFESEFIIKGRFVPKKESINMNINYFHILQQLPSKGMDI